MRWLFLLLLAGCGTRAAPPTRTIFGGDRPVELQVSRRYDHDEPSPLLVLLHGYGVAAEWEERYLGFGEIVDEQNYLLVAPNGTRDADKRYFWNATDACCNFYGSEVDDVGYVVGLIDEISGEYNVDPDRIYLFGHSNGAFLANRIACEHSEQLAAIATLAGVTWIDDDRCAPTSRLSVLHIHGTDDQIIPYDGGQREGLAPHPGATVNTGYWASDLGCGEARQEVERIDVDASVPSDETVVQRYEECPEGVDVELWTIEDGGHIPTVTTGRDPNTFARRVWRFMEAHPKP